MIKIILTVALNFIFIAGFFFLVQHKNGNLTKQVKQLDKKILSQKEIETVVQKFKMQQDWITLQSQNVSELEPLKYQTIQLLLNLSDHIPESVYLTDFVKLEHELLLSGETSSGEELKKFINQFHLKLIKSKGTSFQVSGST